MLPIIVNIPHAGLEIPPDIPFLLPREEVTDRVQLVLARTARIVTDTERFVDDRMESAAKYGQGVIYEKDYLGRTIRREPTKEEREELLNTHYYPHHRMLNQLCAKSLQEYNQAVVLDLHSYPSTYNMGSGQGQAPRISV